MSEDDKRWLFVYGPGIPKRRKAELYLRDGRRFRVTEIPLGDPPAEITRHGLEGSSYAGLPLRRRWRLVGEVDGVLRYEDITDPAVVEAYRTSRCPECRGAGMAQTKQTMGTTTVYIHGICRACEGLGGPRPEKAGVRE